MLELRFYKSLFLDKLKFDVLIAFLPSILLVLVFSFVILLLGRAFLGVVHFDSCQSKVTSGIAYPQSYKCQPVNSFYILFGLMFDVIGSADVIIF